MERRYKIAVIPGDGIGPEVVEGAVTVLEALMRQDPELRLEFKRGDVGEPAYEKFGDPLPEESLELIRASNAVLFGAVGKFATPVILPLRQKFDLYANVRPAYTFEGVPAIQKKVDIIIVRENTEDVYKGIGYAVDDETFVTLRLFTRKGMERIIRYAFELARREGRKSVLLAHKAPVITHTDQPFLDLFNEISREYSDIQARDMLVDSCAMKVIMNPEMFDVILTSNMMGDILSDVTAGIIGGLGFAPSGNIGENTGIFEPIHGSAPEFAGKHVVNPIGAILAAGMMLDWLGERTAGALIRSAVARVLKEGRVRTFDLGGDASTEDMAKEIAKKVNQ
ncbi:MAG: isocitrate/isopropylmalate dehydrogenase family protein [Pseudomonadota bacterium]